MIRNINLPGNCRFGYAGPVESGRGGSRKSPDSFSGASPPIFGKRFSNLSLAIIFTFIAWTRNSRRHTNFLKKAKLSLPLLVPVLGLAFGACSTGNEQNEMNPNNPQVFRETPAECSHNTWKEVDECNAKTRASLVRAIDRQRDNCNANNCKRVEEHEIMVEQTYASRIGMYAFPKGKWHARLVSKSPWSINGPDFGVANGKEICPDDEDRRRAEDEKLYHR